MTQLLACTRDVQPIFQRELYEQNTRYAQYSLYRRFKDINLTLD